VEQHSSTFADHLSELRVRLLHSVIALAVGVAIAFPFQKMWFNILFQPARASLHSLKYLDLPEAFVIHLKLALLAGVLISLPYIAWQLWQFIEPALHEKERRLVVRLSGVSVVLFWSGAAFAYWVVLPIAIKFFMRFQSPELVADITLRNYISFASFMLLVTGFAFETPLVLVFLMATGVVSRAVLARNRRAVVVVILVFSAVFTPPDPLSMLLLAVPFYLLFEGSLLVAWMGQRKQEQAQSAIADE
jgi:sec-independent protein translocase protein TatC